MSWFKRNRKKPPQRIQVPQLRFLGEQDGPPERLLKDKLAVLFHRDKSVIRAYLARVDFGEESNASVILALRTHFGPDKGMLEKVSTIFGSVFNIKEHLDITFLTDDQEVRLTKVCKPFYDQHARE